MEANQAAKYRQILTEVRQLVATPDKWLQHCYATTADYSTVSYADERACRFCLSGAFLHALEAGRLTFLFDSPLFVWLEQFHSGCRSLTSWNDYDKRTHAEVLDMLDRALAALPEPDPSGASPGGP